MTLFLENDIPVLRVYMGDTYGKINFDFFNKFLLPVFLLETTVLSANTFKLASISVEGNNRLSDEAILNYSRLDPNARSHLKI